MCECGRSVRSKRLLFVFVSEKPVSTRKTYYTITKGAHFPSSLLFFSSKKYVERKSHRRREFCVSCDYLFLIWKATVWHVVAAQKYIILWQIATFNNKNSLQVNWGTVTVLPLGKRKRRGKRQLEPSYEWMTALKSNTTTKKNEQENGRRQQLVYVVCWPI